MTQSPQIETVSVERLTIVDVADLYLEEICRRAEASQVSWNHYRISLGRLRRICDYFGRTTPLSEIGKEELMRSVMYFASRPPCQDRPFQRQMKGTPMSIATAKHLIGQVKTLFSWAADHDQLSWERPRGFDRLFRLKRDRLLTSDERHRLAREVMSGEVRVFSCDDLGRLYRAATSRERLFILLGLNCGFTSGEIASLRQFEVQLEGPTPHIHKKRAKTGVEARWTLWPETAALLRKHKAKPNPELLWLVTLVGGPLVEVTQTHRRDSIDKRWSPLVKRALLLNHLWFRFLRKTGANAVKRLGGLEESEMYLAHQEPGLNKHYANRNWPRMWDCLDRFRKELSFLGPTWAIEPEECLFFRTNAQWGDVEPPHSQRVSIRNDLGKLNISYHALKRKFYVRIYRSGKTYCDGYFDSVEKAEEAAKRLRLKLDGIQPTQIRSESSRRKNRSL